MQKKKLILRNINDVILISYMFSLTISERVLKNFSLECGSLYMNSISLFKPSGHPMFYLINKSKEIFVPQNFLAVFSSQMGLNLSLRAVQITASTKF